MQLTVTQAYNDDKKKDGSPITDNKGVQKYRARIKTNEKGDTFLTGFVYKPIHVGDVLNADVKQEMYNGQPQWTFSLQRTPGEKVGGTHTGEVIAELKTHTVLFKQILDKLDGIYMSISTHQTLEILKDKKPEVKDPLEEYLDSDRTAEDYGEPAAQDSEGEYDFDPFGNN